MELSQWRTRHIAAVALFTGPDRTLAATYPHAELRRRRAVVRERTPRLLTRPPFLRQQIPKADWHRHRIATDDDHGAQHWSVVQVILNVCWAASALQALPEECDRLRPRLLGRTQDLPLPNRPVHARTNSSPYEVARFVPLTELTHRLFCRRNHPINPLIVATIQAEHRGTNLLKVG